MPWIHVTWTLSFAALIAFAAAQNEAASDPGPIEVPPEPRNVIPTAQFKGTPINENTFKGIPINENTVAAQQPQEPSQPRTPLSRGADSWTPMGLSGSGAPWTPSPQQIVQDLPYDVSQSQKTIGEQIMQRRQKQQQQQQQKPQEYDIFGFPVNNNNPDPFASLFGGSLFGGSGPSADPFAGLFGGSNHGGLFGGSNQGGLLGNSNQGPAGNMLQTMLLLQLLGGGADAPDPPSPGTGPGRGRPGQRGGPAAEPPSPLEQLLRLEEIRMMRQMQQDRVNNNRMAQENMRGGPMNRRQGGPGGRPPMPLPDRFGPGQRPQVYDNVQTQPSSVSPSNLDQSHGPNQGSGFHPEVLDRRNFPTPAPTPSGQEPVEREGQPGGQRQTSSSPRSRLSQQSNYPEPAFTNSFSLGQPSFNTNFGRGLSNQIQNTVPRNLQQLMNDPLFQRRLRLSQTGVTPGANSADVMADQADRRADYADYLQSLSPLERLLGGGMGMGMGMLGGGMTGGLAGLGLGAMGANSFGMSGGASGLGSMATGGSGGLTGSSPLSGLSGGSELTGLLAMLG